MKGSALTLGIWEEWCERVARDDVYSCPPFFEELKFFGTPESSKLQGSFPKDFSLGVLLSHIRIWVRAFFRCSIDWNPFCSGVCNIRHPWCKNQSHKILNHEPCQKVLVPIVFCFRCSPRRSYFLIFPAHHWLQACAMWYRRFPSCTRDSRPTKTSHSIADPIFWMVCLRTTLHGNPQPSF